MRRIFNEMLECHSWCIPVVAVVQLQNPNISKIRYYGTPNAAAWVTRFISQNFCKFCRKVEFHMINERREIKIPRSIIFAADIFLKITLRPKLWFMHWWCAIFGDILREKLSFCSLYLFQLIFPSFIAYILNFIFPYHHTLLILAVSHTIKYTFDHGR